MYSLCYKTLERDAMRFFSLRFVAFSRSLKEHPKLEAAQLSPMHQSCSYNR